MSTRLSSDQDTYLDEIKRLKISLANGSTGLLVATTPLAV